MIADELEKALGIIAKLHGETSEVLWDLPNEIRALEAENAELKALVEKIKGRVPFKFQSDTLRDAHFIEIDVRRNAQNERYEADWLKHVLSDLFPLDDKCHYRLSAKQIEEREQIIRMSRDRGARPPRVRQG